jgi:uncharacterized protein
MKSWPPTYLAESDQQAIEALVTQLVLRHGGNVNSITLFGSKARGDDTPQSDIDLLVIVEREDWELKHEIRILGARFSLNYDVLFNLYIVAQERWGWMKAINHPLYRQILAEGMDLTPVNV